jgi:serine/threonine protein kinase
MSAFPLLATQHDMLGDKFELLESLGAGSFGEVWKARRIADNAVVALKIPRDRELGEEFLRREPELMRAFDHPHIVHVYGYHTIGSLFVIEME